MSLKCILTKNIYKLDLIYFEKCSHELTLTDNNETKQIHVVPLHIQIDNINLIK